MAAVSTSNADGSVVITVDMDVSDAEKELARLKKRVWSLEDDIGEKEAQRVRLVQKRLALEKDAEKLENQRQSLLNNGQPFDNEDFDLPLIDIYKQIKDINAQIDKLDRSIDSDQASLDYTKNRYANIAAQADSLRRDALGLLPDTNAGSFRSLADDVEVANQKIVALNQELSELKARQKELNQAGFGLGFQSYDDNVARIAEIQRELDLYQKKLQSVSLADPLRDVASDAEVANQRIIDLNRELTELKARQKELKGLGTGVGYQEFDDNARRIAEIQKDIETYQKSLQNLSAAEPLEEIAENAEIADQYVADLNRELAELQIRQKELENAGSGLGFLEYDQNTERIAEINQELKNYKKSLEDAAKARVNDDAQSRLSAWMQKSGGLLQKLDDMIGQSNALSGVWQDMSDKISGAMEKIQDSVEQIGQETVDTLVKGGKIIASFADAAASGLVRAVSMLGKFGASAVKIVGTLGGNAAKFAGNCSVLPKAADSLREKLESLGNVLRKVLDPSMITGGLQSVRSLISGCLQANETLTAALRRLQGVLLTAFQPIYEIVVPALTTLINVLTYAAAAIAQFFAALFGTTAKQAQVNADALYNQAAATTAAGSAAEDAALQLAAFDEINKLEGTKSAGGGGAASVDMGPLFDYEYDQTPFDDWGMAFSGFLDKLLDGISKLREAFHNFADWLNDLARKIYDMFTFPGVLDKVKQLGKELADALNNLVNWIDWELLGRALGAGLNLALNFLTSFLYDFDWMNLGRKLAGFVNGLADEIDWYEFGRLLWAGFKIGLETLAGFITGLDMPLLANAASQTVFGFFDEMLNTVNRIPWKEIGQQIARFLNAIDWHGIITSAWSAISAAVNALFTMVRGFIDELHWSDIATQIYRAINDSIGKIKWDNIGKTIGDAFQRIFDFVKTVIAGISWHQLGENIATFILSFDIAGALGGLADLIAAGINAAVQTACGMLDKIQPVAIEIASGIAERLKNAVESVDWKKMGEVVGNGVKTALSFAAGLLDPALFYQIGKAIGDFLVNLDWPGIVGGLADALASGIASAVSAVRGLLDAAGPHLQDIAAGIGSKINEFVRNVDWAELGRTISDGIVAALDFVIQLLQSIDWDAVGEAVHTALSSVDWESVAGRVASLLTEWFAVKTRESFLKMEAMAEIGSAVVEGIKAGILSAVASIFDWLRSHLVDPIVNGVKNLLGIHSPSTVFAEIGAFMVEGLLLGVSQNWQSVADFFSGSFEKIRQTVLDTWEKVRASTSETWENIKTTLTAIWDTLKEKASSVFEAIREKIVSAWEAVSKKTASAWENIRSVLTPVWEKLKSSAESTFNTIKEKIVSAWDTVREKTASTWESIRSTLTPVWENLKSTAESAFNAIKEKIISTWTALKTDASAKWAEIKNTLLNTWTELKSSASGKFQEIKQSIIDKMGELQNHDWAGIGRSIADGILSGLQSIWSSLSSWARSVKDTISDALSGAGSSRSGSFGSSYTGGGGFSRIAVQSMPDLNNFEVPMLAKGAVIPPNRQFLAVLGDQTSGTNVEAPLATIEQAVANVMGRMGGTNGSNRSQTVVLEIDGREFGRAVVDFGGNEYQRIGVRLVEARA